MDSVANWCESNKFDYRFIADELFSPVPAELLSRYENQKVIATDLARLLWLQKLLRQGYKTVIWCDADFLIFKPDSFNLLNDAYALGREVWIQADQKGGLRAYRKVHNAFLMFRRGNTFLDFYAETAERLLTMNRGNVPPQFIGPKLLTALHNIVQCPVMESAGMLSPLVIKDMIAGKGKALALFERESVEPVTAANLSFSVAHEAGITNTDMNRLIDTLTNE